MQFSDAQLKGLATIFSDTGQVLLASVVVPFLFGLVTMSTPAILTGLFLTLFCHFTSIRLLKGVDKNE